MIWTSEWLTLGSAFTVGGDGNCFACFLLPRIYTTPAYERLMEDEGYADWVEGEYEAGHAETAKQGISHMERVRNIRKFLKQARLEEEAKGESFDPLFHLSICLNRECWKYLDSGEDYAEEGYARFFGQLEQAWDALIYDRVRDSRDKLWIGNQLRTLRYERRNSGEEPEDGPIVLEYPLQLDVLYAMTEAVGIPYKRGQSHISFPSSRRKVSVQEVVFDQNFTST